MLAYYINLNSICYKSAIVFKQTEKQRFSISPINNHIRSHFTKKQLSYLHNSLPTGPYSSLPLVESLSVKYY